MGIGLLSAHLDLRQLPDGLIREMGHPRTARSDILMGHGVAYRQTVATFGASTGQNCAAVFGGHAGPKAMLIHPLAISRLECSLHFSQIFRLKLDDEFNSPKAIIQGFLWFPLQLIPFPSPLIPMASILVAEADLGYLYLVRKYLFHLYIEVVGNLLALFLLLFRWKAHTIRSNRIRCGFSDSSFAHLRLFRHLAADLLRFLAGQYGKPMGLRPSDGLKYQELRTQGGLLLVGHFHNWELMGGWLSRNGVPLIACAKPLSNSLANGLLNQARKRIGLPTLTGNWAVRSRQCLREGRVVAFLWDQRPDRQPPTFPGTFLGQPVEMNRLPGFLTREGVFPIYFGAFLPDGEIRLVGLGRSPMGRGKLARRYNRVLGKLVSRHPDYWYGWTHRRFG